MVLTEQSKSSRTAVNTCQSGDTRFFLVPGNFLGQLTKLSVDTAFASGQFGPILVQIRDSFLPLGGSSGTILRYQTRVLAGDVLEIPMEGEVQLFGGIDVRVDLSGPVVGLGAAFR